MNEHNIIITGFMGTGKSTVSHLVAEKLGRTLVDTDAEIEKRIGKSVAQIFADEGEAYFRLIERRMCRFLAAQRGYVIATGGGMLIDDGNRDVMLASGTVVCLMADAEVLAERLRADQSDRPLMKGNWRALLEQRRSAYAAIPNQIDTSQKSPEQVADEIVALCQAASV
jgi:shikimate kinase